MDASRIRIEIIDLNGQILGHCAWREYIMMMEKTNMDEYKHVSNQISILEAKKEVFKLMLGQEG